MEIETYGYYMQLVNHRFLLKSPFSTDTGIISNKRQYKETSLRRPALSNRDRYLLKQ